MAIIVNVLVKRKILLVPKNRTPLSPYFADTMRKLFKNSMKPHINSIENSVNPDQLIRIHTVFYTTWPCEFIIIDNKNEIQNCINFVYTCPIIGYYHRNFWLVLNEMGPG